jgi:hypothetical protein
MDNDDKDTIPSNLGISGGSKRKHTHVCKCKVCGRVMFSKGKRSRKSKRTRRRKMRGGTGNRGASSFGSDAASHDSNDVQFRAGNSN